VQVLRVGHLVARDEERADRTERVAALALVPLAEAFELVLALGEVVDDAKTRDVLERALWAHVLRRAADHEAELDFPVALREPRGITTSSLGPTIALVAFMNTTGSAGTCAPVSAAWSA
jgi:hypothetical protein